MIADRWQQTPRNRSPPPPNEGSHCGCAAGSRQARVRYQVICQTGVRILGDGMRDASADSEHREQHAGSERRRQRELGFRTSGKLGFGFWTSGKRGFAPCPSKGVFHPQTAKARTRDARMDLTRTRDSADGRNPNPELRRSAGAGAAHAPMDRSRTRNWPQPASGIRSAARRGTRPPSLGSAARRGARPPSLGSRAPRTPSSRVGP